MKKNYNFTVTFETIKSRQTKNGSFTMNNGWSYEEVKKYLIGCIIDLYGTNKRGKPVFIKIVNIDLIEISEG